MAQPQEKLAQSLAALHVLQSSGKDVFRSSDFTRTHLERLQQNGFLQRVLQGWYIASRPGEGAGESTSWFTSFWRFSAEYLKERFGDEWCLSPEQSILLHTGNRTVPRQLLVRAAGGTNKPRMLLHGTSILDLRLSVPTEDVEPLDGMRVVKLPAAMIACAPGFFVRNPMEAKAALLMLSKDPQPLLERLLEGGHSTIAGRLAGAFRNVGKGEVANEITAVMKAAGYKVFEGDPFEPDAPAILNLRDESPHASRLRLLWEAMRKDVLEIFPKPAVCMPEPQAYLKCIDDVFVTDAYNSLSIEGYQVTEGLIQRVQSGKWNPEADAEDKELRSALAARGYWQAFQAVKSTIEIILTQREVPPGEQVRRDHQQWYRELFAPSVAAGILNARDLAGYRSGPVYIRQSMHLPPGHEAVRRDLMPTFFDVLASEPEPAVRAVLGHFAFVYIHPYTDGNGRIARFLMNTMLASGGYSWTVIPVERRAEYMNSLEAASVGKDIKPFASFMAAIFEAASTPLSQRRSLVP